MATTKQVTATGPGHEESIKVLCRIRPFNSREIQLHEASNLNKEAWELHPLRSVIEFQDKACIFLDPEHDWVQKEQFVFDKCIWSIPDEQQVSANGYSNQKDVFEAYGKEVLNTAWQGYNTCFFAYGQTGSGKTYSMMGQYEPIDQNIKEDEGSVAATIDQIEWKGADPGLTPRICKALFEQIEEKVLKAMESKEYIKTFRVSVQYLEIYNEQVKDLLFMQSDLPPEQKEKIAYDNMKIRFTPTTGVFVEHLTTVTVTSWQEMIDMIDLGNNSRTTAATKMNEMSSRSHAVFKVILTQVTASVPKEQFAKPQEYVCESCINLVDLAGSERNKKTGATGDRLKEAANINKSLFALKSVIDALVDNCTIKGTKKRIPYRDSHLTSILMDSLGGNSKTFMLVTASPHVDNAEETLQTLKYGSRARQIVTVVHVNESAAGRKMLDLEVELKRMKEEAIKAEEDAKNTEDIEDMKAQVIQQEAEIVRLSEELQIQAAKMEKMQREKDAQIKYRSLIALARMEIMSIEGEEKDKAAETENALRNQLEQLTDGDMMIEKQKVQMMEEIEETRTRTEELRCRKNTIEAEVDSSRKASSKSEAKRWELQRKLNDDRENFFSKKQARLGIILLYRLERIRNVFAHEERIETLGQERIVYMEAQLQKQSKQIDDICRSQDEEIFRLEQLRNNINSDLDALKVELVRVENERSTQIAKMSDRVQNLTSENKKRKEAMTTRLAAFAHSHKRRYDNMVATVGKQYSELMDEMSKHHATEEKEMQEKLQEIRQEHAKEVCELEAEWRQKISAAITLGKHDFQDTKVRWDMQFIQRQHMLNQLRVRLHEIEKKEQRLAIFNSKVANVLARTKKPRSAHAKKLFDSLQLFHGEYEEHHPNRGFLANLLKKDISECRCEESPEIGFMLSRLDSPTDSVDKDDMLRRPSVWSMNKKPTGLRSQSPNSFRAENFPKSVLFYPQKSNVQVG